MQNVYEQFFGLMYYGRWDFQQAYNLPVRLRSWFIKRLIKEKEKEQEAAANVGKQKSPPPYRAP